MAWFVRLLLLLSFVLPGGMAIAAERTLLTQKDLARASSLAATSTVRALRAKAVSGGKVPVIVGLAVPFAAEGRLGRAAAAQQRLEIESAAKAFRSRYAAAIQRAPGAFRTYETLPFAALEVTAAELDRLAADPGVVSITENKLVSLSLAQSVPLIRAPEAWAAGFNGEGQTIAIIDTGVDKTHPFLAGKVVSEACYSLVRDCPNNTASSTVPGSGMPCNVVACEHGTHVAGIAAGSGMGTSGVAPGAKLIAIRVFSGPFAWTADIVAGLERVYQLRNDFQIAAVNMSLGAGRYTSSCDGEVPSFDAAIASLLSAQIAVVVSSGNDGFTNAISSPACISGVVSVGSVHDSNAPSAACPGTPGEIDKVACYSNSSQILSLLAPGTTIISSVPGGGMMAMEGTSMAAPHVAGAWAVLKGKMPGATIDQVLAALKNNGKRVTDGRNNITTSRIDVAAALGPLDGGKRSVRVSMPGDGAGTVSFSPAGSVASCTSSCSSAYVKDTTVTLTAQAAPGANFVGWSGDCSGTAPCVLVLSLNKTVVANFTKGSGYSLSYYRTGAAGTVSFSPATTFTSCADNCTALYSPKTRVKLTAKPGTDTLFAGWEGACRGKSLTCSVTMKGTTSVTAKFYAPPPLAISYTKAGTGAGRVTFTAPGRSESCDASCAKTFSTGTIVKLQAAPSPGSRFTGWTGACRGKRQSCTLRLKAAANVTATFSSGTASVAAE